jgi:hypothetical protein
MFRFAQCRRSTFTRIRTGIILLDPEQYIFVYWHRHKHKGTAVHTGTLQKQFAITHFSPATDNVETLLSCDGSSLFPESVHVVVYTVTVL